MSSSVDLTEKPAIVTGAASGIGKACAERLAACGANVVVCDINETDGAATAKAITDNGGKATFIPHDVSVETRWEEVFTQAENIFSPVNILVNNAAFVQFSPITDLSHDLWRKHIAINLDGVFFGVRSAMQRMPATGGGSIINMSSIGATRGGPFVSAYAMTKAAIVGFSKSAAIECGKLGLPIRINAVMPGFIDTPMHQQVPDHDINAVAAAATAIGRAGQPLEIADAVCFLASDAASYITGSELFVDGGLL